MEWALKQDIFTAIIGRMGNCDRDLFATRKNCKLEKYVSYVPDKRSCAVNEFSISWKQYTNYAFPPLSIIRQVIQKLCEHLAEMILVAPAMVPANVETSERTLLSVTQNKQHTVYTRDREETSANHNETRGISIVRECIISAGLSEDTADIIMQSWRPAPENFENQESRGSHLWSFCRGKFTFRK